MYLILMSYCKSVTIHIIEYVLHEYIYNSAILYYKMYYIISSKQIN